MPNLACPTFPTKRLPMPPFARLLRAVPRVILAPARRHVAPGCKTPGCARQSGGPAQTVAAVFSPPSQSRRPSGPKTGRTMPAFGPPRQARAGPAA